MWIYESDVATLHEIQNRSHYESALHGCASNRFLIRIQSVAKAAYDAGLQVIIILALKKNFLIIVPVLPGLI
jgi:hypothetical protein